MTNNHSISKLIVYVVLFVTGLSQPMLAQQVPLYQQYIYNRFVYNPAYSGFDETANVNLIHRSQWLDMPGQPITTAVTFDGPIKPKKIGLGLNMYGDKTDITSRLGFYGSFAYNIGIGDDQNLMFGLSLGGLQNRIDFSQVVVRDIDDPALLKDVERKQGLDGTFGLAYRWKELHFGVAIPQIMASKFDYPAVIGNSRATYNLARHYMVSLDYKIFVNSAQDVSLKPMFLVRYMPEAPMQFDANLVFNWHETAFLAISYRSDYAIGINARVKINKKISVGYTYDVISSTINTYSGISHELLLGYAFAGGGADTKELEELQEKVDSLSDELAANSTRYNDLIAEGDRLYEEGKFMEAKAAYEKALALQPGEEYPQSRISKINQSLDKQYQEAISRADVLFKSGDYEGARRAYEEALKYKSGDEYAQNQIESIETSNTSKYSDAIARGDALFKSRDYEGAKKAYTEALKHKPMDAYARDKINKTTKIIALFDDRYNSLIKVADSLFMAKQFKAAREKYAQAGKFSPNSKYSKEMMSMIDNNQTGGDIRMVKSSDFLDEYGNKASKGFYVVMASFKSKENADGLKSKKGYKSVYNKVRGFHYVYMSMKQDYKGAKMELMNRARKETPDAWIYILR